MAKELDPRVARFGRRIKALREARPGLSQEALAVAVGYSRSAIANLETGRLDPVLSRAFALADYFSIPLRPFLPDREEDVQPSASSLHPALREVLGRLEEDAVRLLRSYDEVLHRRQIRDDVQPEASIMYRSFLEIFGWLEYGRVRLLRRYAEALHRGRTGEDAQLSIPLQGRVLLELLGELEDDRVGLLRRYGALFHGRPFEEDVQLSASSQRHTFTDLLVKLGEDAVHLLRRYDEVLHRGRIEHQGQLEEEYVLSIISLPLERSFDLDRHLAYLEDIRVLRCLQQDERKGDGKESAPAG